MTFAIQHRTPSSFWKCWRENNIEQKYIAKKIDQEQHLQILQKSDQEQQKSDLNSENTFSKICGKR